MGIGLFVLAMIKKTLHYKKDCRINLTQASLAFFLGSLPLLFLPKLLSVGCLIMLVIIICCLLYLPYGVGHLFAISLFAVLWGHLQANNLFTTMDKGIDLKSHIDVMITSTVIEGSQFYNLQAKIINIDDKIQYQDANIQIYWNEKLQQKPHCAGQIWRLYRPKIRVVHSGLNQGGFDWQRFSVSQRKMLTVSVKKALLLDDNCTLRHQIITKTYSQIRELPMAGLMIGLLFGERQLIDQDKNKLLKQTGVAHIMAISGLHISLASLFGVFIARGIQLILPARYLSHFFPPIIGLIFAFSYGWLSGFALPSTRALIALILWFYISWRRINCSHWHWLIWSAALILLLDPLAILSNSFWLSFSAVTALLFWNDMSPRSYHVKNRRFRNIYLFLSMQLGLLILLIPIQLFVFNGANVTSIIANSWVIPLVSFLIVPILLIGLGLLWLPQINGFFWLFADRTLEFCFSPLTYLQPFWRECGDISLLVIVIVWGGLFVYRLGFIRSEPVFCLLTLLVLFVYQHKQIIPLWQFSLLDVGHGLAIVIEKEGRAIIYDTGDAKNGYSHGERTVIPYLRYKNLTPDMVILSHDHSDHTGGFASIIHRYPSLMIKKNFGISPQGCIKGEQWYWQSLLFQVLWPPKSHFATKNNYSCVIMISDGRYRLLLTGDTEKQAEYQLVRQGVSLNAHVLQVPHHGSNTSSTLMFIQSVKPLFALVSVARYSPWRLPSDKVRHRYKKLKVEWRDTKHAGQISGHIYTDKIEIKNYRQHISPRWFHAYFGNWPVNE